TEEYVALRAGNDVLIVAAKLADEFVRVAKLTGVQVVARMPGRNLDGLEYRHPWIDRTGKVAVADFVAMDTGTGLVHVAPGHGEADYDLGRARAPGHWTPFGGTCAGSPRGGRTGSSTWSRTARTGRCRGSASGACPSSPSTASSARHSCWRSRSSSTWRASSARAGASRSGT